MLVVGCSIYDGALPQDQAGMAGPGSGNSDIGASGASGRGALASTVGAEGSNFAGAGTAGAGGTVGGSSGAGSSQSDDGGPAGQDVDTDSMADPIDSATDTACSKSPLCALRSVLVHRYSFDGSGTVVTDSVGAADGTVMHAQLSGTGALALAGGTSDQYVDLPNGIIHQLENATFEAWITWAGGAGWQRIFDFGNSDGLENAQGMGVTTLHLTPQGTSPKLLLAGFKRADQLSSAETLAVSSQALAMGAMVQVAVVIDDTHDQMLLYQNGALEGLVAFRDSLSMLTDVNNWLGRSQYTADPEFGGTFLEFRIYSAALSQEQIQASYAAGSDAPFNR